MIYGSGSNGGETGEAEALTDALVLLETGMVLLEATQACMAVAHLDASILQIQSRLRNLNHDDHG